MTRHHPPLGPPETPGRQAFEMFRESGVYSPQHAGAIAEYRRIAREWADVGQPLDGDEAAPGPGSRADTEGSY